MRSRAARTFAIASLGLLVALPAGALILDWDDNPWPGTGTTTAAFDVDGDDVIVSILNAGNLDSGSGPAGSPGSPSTTSFLAPPGNTGDNLFLKAIGNTGPYVTVTFDFTHTGGVKELGFSVYDVDILNFFGICCYIDQISVTATDGVSTFGPSSVTADVADPSWTYDGTDTITGDANAGEDEAEGTVNFTFDQMLTSFSVIYRNELSAGQVQWIGFSALTFTRAPEPSTGSLLALGLLGLAARRRRRS